MPKIINGEVVDILNRVHLYFGVYDGRTRPVDKEAQGVLYYKFDDLIDEMKTTPQIFSKDLHILVEVYEKEMRAFIEKVRKIKKNQ